MSPIDELREFVRAVGERYQLGRLLGMGGWGSVFAAEDLRTGAVVALKVLSLDQTSAQGRLRFLQEMAIAGRLSHPGIVPMIDSGEAAGLPYFVMPLIQGPTLEARLAGEPQLAVPEAVRIARQVAEALAYAHRAGVVHRDIKPGNILLAADRALVADFGIARALSRSAPSPLVTSTGVTIGTPMYMSPEQGAGTRELDGRSDIYSLGIVLYQMLAGTPPFSGSSERAVIARHAADLVPPIHTVRPSVPAALEDIVYRALAKAPADRFQDADAMAEALARAASEPLVSVVERPRLSGRGRARWIAVAGLAVLAVGWVGARLALAVADQRALGSADSTWLLVAPVPVDLDPAVSKALEEGVERALRRWTGLRLVGTGAFDSEERASMGADDASLRRAALGLGARRYVKARLLGEGERARLALSLTDASEPSQPAGEVEVPWPEDARARDSALNDAVLRLVVRRPLPRAWEGSALLTRSLPARQAFGRGVAAFDRWDLAEADSMLGIALQFDPELADAALWRAAARHWSGVPSARWSVPARAAATGRDRLSAVDRERTAAFLDVLAGDPVAACRRWEELIHRDSASFVAWYGSATCLARDRAVLRDRSSPSGWRFRTSYRAALARYRRAFELHPAILRSLRRDGYQEMRRLLKVNAGMVRDGLSATGPTAVFYSSATLDADTLAFVPFPAAEFETGDHPRLIAVMRTVSAATRRQQELFRDVALTWITSEPRSSEAREALAWAQLLLGDAAALDTLASARRLATSPLIALQLQGQWAWMRAILSYPNDVAGMTAAERAADSVLTSPRRDGLDVGLVSGLAVLTGRVELAVAFETASASELNTGLITPLAGPARALLVRSAVGVRGGAVLRLEQQLDSLIDALTAPDQRARVRLQAFGRAATLAPLRTPLRRADEVTNGGPLVAMAQAAWRQQDTAAVRMILRQILRERRVYSAADLALDVVVPEAELLAEMGDRAGAVAWLDPVLMAVRTRAATPDPITAAVLMRAAAVRVRLALSVGDTATARRWAEPGRTLLRQGDAALRALVLPIPSTSPAR